MNFVARDGIYELTFPDGTRLVHNAPGRDARGGLPGELEAYNAQGDLVNAARVDVLSPQQRQSFAQECEATDAAQTAAAWRPRLVAFVREILLALQHGPPPLPLPPPPPAFPLQVLPAPLRTFVTAAATALPCPPDFLAVPLLAVLGAAIGTTRLVEIKPGWRESARLWTAVMDEPGSKKSPALDLVVRPLYAIQHDFAEQYTAAKCAYEAELVAYEVELADWKAEKPRLAADKPRKPDTPRFCRSVVPTPPSKRWPVSWSRIRGVFCSFVTN